MADNIIRKDLITQKFGNRSRVERYSGGVNRGTDFAVPTGTPVSLPEGRWKVVEAFSGATASGPNNRQRGINSGYGNSVVVQNLDTGEKMRFSHLSRVNGKLGQEVKGGDIVGLTGATGNVAGKTGQHLDLEYFDEKGQLRDIMQSRYAGEEGSEGNKARVSSMTIEKGTSGNNNMQTDWNTTKTKALQYAKQKGLNAEQTQKLLDYAATKFEIQTGKIKPADIKDPSIRVEARETQKANGLSVDNPFATGDTAGERAKAGTYPSLKKDIDGGMTFIDLLTKYGRDFTIPEIQSEYEKVQDKPGGYGKPKESEVSKISIAKGELPSLDEGTLKSIKQEIINAGSRESALSQAKEAEEELTKAGINANAVYDMVNEEYPEEKPSKFFKDSKYEINPVVRDVASKTIKGIGDYFKKRIPEMVDEKIQSNFITRNLFKKK